MTNEFQCSAFSCFQYLCRELNLVEADSVFVNGQQFALNREVKPIGPVGPVQSPVRDWQMGDVSSSASTLQMATSAQAGRAVPAIPAERWLQTDNRPLNARRAELGLDPIVRDAPTPYEIMAHGGRVGDLGAVSRGLPLVRPTVSSRQMAPIQEGNVCARSSHRMPEF